MTGSAIPRSLENQSDSSIQFRYNSFNFDGDCDRGVIDNERRESIERVEKRKRRRKGSFRTEWKFSNFRKLNPE